jgi:hypothetical protein
MHSVQAHSGAFWCILVHSGAFWCILVHSVLYAFCSGAALQLSCNLTKDVE